MDPEKKTVILKIVTDVDHAEEIKSALSDYVDDFIDQEIAKVESLIISEES